ncbi:MAG: 50S ribosomal protein L4 [Candidatus Eisenbacteria bacterium]|uniref:Large ribosomal subunit protein uL4 n=1 Tax=Eiseniibacteriota bacterium TaxID=2212470 RepID=A0A7Y2E666_UNCEI|nr:50S ribosomal protein L4 [Candidatus Eisenbacteria bacterium]
MSKAKHYSTDGSVKGEIDLPQGAFGVEPNMHVVWEAVKTYLANQRQGNASTKSRSYVSGGGRKPFKQKGTGRARQGSIRAAQMVGGYTVFGPHPRSYNKTLPKKIKRLALTSVMSARAQDGNVAVIDELSLNDPKTKTMMGVFNNMELGDRKVCLITKDSNPNIFLSCRNIPGVSVLPHSAINVYDMTNADVLVFTEGALNGIQEVYGG